MTDSAQSPRYPLIDGLRGSAIVMMIIFHFCFDLTTFGYAKFDFYHSPFWLHFRTLIISLFTLIVGMSLYLSHRRGIHWPRFSRRFAILVGCAALITVTTYFSNGSRYIYFGILHFIALASLLALPFVRLYWTNLLLGSGLLILDYVYQNPLFHRPYLQFIGFMQYKPATDDYAPLIPWFGLVLIGIFFAKWAIDRQHLPLFTHWQARTSLARTLCLGGRHSLLIYMLHQPLFYALFYLLQLVKR